MYYFIPEYSCPIKLSGIATQESKNLKRCCAQRASDSAMFNSDILISATLVKHIIAEPQGEPAKGRGMIRVCREQVGQH